MDMRAEAEEGVKGFDLGCGLRRVGVRVKIINKVLKPNCYIYL